MYLAQYMKVVLCSMFTIEKTALVINKKKFYFIHFVSLGHNFLNGEQFFFLKIS